MANSLEVRVPLLDHKLVEFVFSLPASLIYKNEELKYLLKKVASPFLPEETVKRKKKGFSVPLTQWRFNERYKPLLNDSYLARDGILNKEKLTSYLKDGFSEDKLWMLILLELWYRKWFVQEKNTDN
jgi:asparagine synthase (glutamine-hydrolysing)